LNCTPATLTGLEALADTVMLADTVCPVRGAVRDTVGGVVLKVKVAVTDCAAVIVTWQEPVPEQAFQLEKSDPAPGAAVRVTTVAAV
jgi:hypothetical protein